MPKSGVPAFRLCGHRPESTNAPCFSARVETLPRLVPLLFLLGLSCGIDSGLDMDASYATYADAEKGGAVTRGWVPNFVPQSATSIQEFHNLDTNVQLMTFRFDPSDLALMREKLTPSDPDTVRTPYWRPRAWWAQDLRGPSEGLSVKYNFFRAPGSAANFVAIEKDVPRAWFCVTLR